MSVSTLKTEIERLGYQVSVIRWQDPSHGHKWEVRLTDWRDVSTDPLIRYGKSGLHASASVGGDTKMEAMKRAHMAALRLKRGASVA